MMGGCGPFAAAPDGQAPMFVQGRIAFLKTELGITDAQAPAWEAYAAAIKDNFTNMQGLHQAMRAAFDAENPVARMDAHIAVLESRAATLKELRKPLGALYATLDAAQKQKADALLTGMGCMM